MYEEGYMNAEGYLNEEGYTNVARLQDTGARGVLVRRFVVHDAGDRVDSRRTTAGW